MGNSWQKYSREDAKAQRQSPFVPLRLRVNIFFSSRSDRFQTPSCISEYSGAQPIESVASIYASFSFLSLYSKEVNNDNKRLNNSAHQKPST